MNFRAFLFCIVLMQPFLALGQNPQPKLILILTIDQGRGDYLERFRPVLRYGLLDLIKKGVVFDNVQHLHANTVTASGHASLSTGRHPRHSGMVGNDWYERKENKLVYCVSDPESAILPPANSKRTSLGGRSPKRLLTDGLGDWIQNKNSNSKVYSIGGKDRSSIVMGGQNADGVYWFDPVNGQWVTSHHYTKNYPVWINTVHSESLSGAYLGQDWNPIAVSDETLREMDIVPSEFSYRLGESAKKPDQSFYTDLYNSPFIESYLLNFAENIVRNEKLGSDTLPDILALSFSSVDAVGHSFGPNSRELLDTIIRLDRNLGNFFTLIDELVGIEHVAIALSADHGVAPLPEHQTNGKHKGKRLSKTDEDCFNEAQKSFEKKFGKGWFVHPYTFDNNRLQQKKTSRIKLENFLAKELRRCSSVEAVWTRTDIENNAISITSQNSALELYRNSFHLDRSPDLFIQLRKGYMSRQSGTTHGSPYIYDRDVFAILFWPGIKHSTVSEQIYTVDLSVTLASLLRIPIPENVDGLDRSKLLQ